LLSFSRNSDDSEESFILLIHEMTEGSESWVERLVGGSVSGL